MKTLSCPPLQMGKIPKSAPIYVFISVCLGGAVQLRINIDT